MIDSDSDGDDEPPIKRTYSRSRDVKPDVHKLNKQIAKEKNKASAANSGDSFRDIKPDTSAGGNNIECSTCRENEESVRRVQQNLNDLRRNVWELMQVIVPDLELENMEMVDQVVVEMVRVNKRADGESQGSSEAADGKDEDSKSVKTERGSVSQSDVGQNETVNGNAALAENNATEAADDEDETQDPCGSADNHEDTSVPRSCNGQVLPNEIKTKAEIKAENEESQSQSLLSNVRKSENKVATVKER